MRVPEPWQHDWRDPAPSDRKRAWRLVRELVTLIGRIPQRERGALEGVLLVLEKYVDDRSFHSRG